MRYFFHFMDGVEATDSEGIECADAVAARNQAIVEARALAAEDVQNGRLNLRDRIVVSDQDGATLFIVTFRDAIAVSY